jgi:peroxiredoxin (alkyl hydroperoxide reductase subunit C)
MGKPFKAGCARPQKTIENKIVEPVQKEKVNEEEKAMVKVGQEVPNFELSGYHKGEFKQFTLEEFRGKWVLLCFYPGDFTFV